MADVWINFDEDEDAYHVVIDGLVLYLTADEVQDLEDELHTALMENE